jgi:hypothetical protein
MTHVHGDKFKGGNFMAKREMKKQNVEETNVEQAVEQSEPVVSTEAPKEQKKEGGVTKGVVTGCEKLNIRKAPKSDAPVVTIVDAGTELKIFDPDKAINGWYKTEKGFCMKQYVKIK